MSQRIHTESKLIVKWHSVGKIVRRARLEGAAAPTVLNWNQGAGAMGQVLEKLGVEDLGMNTLSTYRTINETRIKNLNVKCSSKYRRRRKLL